MMMMMMMIMVAEHLRRRSSFFSGRRRASWWRQARAALMVVGLLLAAGIAPQETRAASSGVTNSKMVGGFADPRFAYHEARFTHGESLLPGAASHLPGAIHAPKARGLWNPDPLLLQAFQHLESREAVEERINQLVLADVGVGNGAQQPTKDDWTLGPNHWPAFYMQFVPNVVTDLCGGVPGMARWKDVSPACASWTINLMRCVQVCNHSNRFGGFGNCMIGCQQKCKQVCTN